MGNLRGWVRILLAKRVLLILTIVALNGANLFILLRSPGAAAVPASLAPITLEKNVNLTCDQALRLMQWGKGRARHAADLDLKSRDFTKKALTTFLEKLDPQRILFTAREAKRFQSNGRSAWKKWMDKKSCEYFESFMSEEYPAARKRLKDTIAGIAIPNTIAKGAVEADNLRYPRFTEFANNESDLKDRVLQWVERLRQGVSGPLLEAYGGDMRAAVSDALDQILFETDIDARGALAKAALGTIDAYSTYFTPGEFEDFYYDLAGGTSGVGIKVRKVPDGLLVEKVVPDSPAGRSGKLKAGQIITAVDGKKLGKLTSIAAKNLLKGTEGSKVKLEVLKGYKGKSYHLTLHRQHFNFDDAKITHRLLKPKNAKHAPVAVIDIPSFYGRGGMGDFEEERSSSEDLREILEELVKPKSALPSAVVLDLRGNPGGFLEEAVAMAGLFLGDRPVVEVVESDAKRILRHDERKPLYNGPLVLLLDEETASASEVLAGALKDHQRAVLIGSERTYGKGSVQKLFHLDEDLLVGGLAPVLGRGVVKLTTSVFYSPLGHSPANGGVKTHFALPRPKESEDFEPAPEIAAVPEEKPFLDESAMVEVRRKEEALKPRLTVLESFSKERVKFDPGAEAKQVEAATDPKWELEEAVAIANDFVSLEAKDTAMAKP